MSMLDIPKPLIQIDGRPIIYYPVINLYEYGVREFVIIVNEQTVSVKMELQELINDISIEVVYQQNPEGTAKALAVAEKILSGKSFIMTYCDNIGDSRLSDLENLFDKNRYSLGVMSITDIPKNPSTAQAIIENGLIIKLYEKPPRAVSRWKVFPVFLFTDRIFRYIREVKLHENEEYGLTEVINIAIGSGETLGYIINHQRRLNVNAPEDITKASKLLKEGRI